MTDFKRIARNWLPPVAGVVLIGLFLSLAAWQLDRAAQKESLAALFDASAAPVRFEPGGGQPLYRPVVAAGHYLDGRQFLIDNIVRNQRLGYFVITPLALRDDAPLVLVNRGFVPKGDVDGELPDIAVDGGEREVRARIGRLPRVALRPENAIEAGQGWPRVAVYPEARDIARTLGRPVAETVLLLSPRAADGFERQWRPDTSGPMMHYGYAFQWSALALAVLVVLAWQLKKRFKAHNDDG